MTSPLGLNADFSQSPYYRLAAPENRPQGGVTSWGSQQPTRKPPTTEEGSLFDVSKSRAFFHHNKIVFDRDLTNLKRSYGFPANDSVAAFLAKRQAISPVLLSAVPHLKEHFGADSIVNLEVSTDDDGSQTLYAVAVWHNTVRSAAQALEDFFENWWLDHMTASTADLAFTYEIF